MEGKKTAPDKEFTPVDIEQFFDKDEIEEIEIPTGIVVLTTQEKTLVDNLIENLKIKSPDKVEGLNNRMADLERLAAAIAHFPSLLERSHMTAGVRTPQALIESLISNQDDGDSALHLPSKATLGKGFLVAKIHTFAALIQLARGAHVKDAIIKGLADETVSMTFLLLAEDVYLNLIKDTSLPKDFRRQLAISLLLLWEHRSDQNINDISPVLSSVWQARRQLAPAFGTMVGTSELLLMSIQMDETWTSFIKEKLGESDVSQSMEEFLFGLSYEQVVRLRTILREKGISAIGRDEVSSFLGQRVKTDVSLDYRDFYLMYTVRRDNARARERLDLPGPHKTLEDHFIRFVMEKNRDKQRHDIFAKK